MNSIPRPEHPKPQFRRDNWLNLNGEWEFVIDNGRSGKARRFFEKFPDEVKKINVPFCPESDLSGVGYKDFMYGVWYRRTVLLKDCQLDGRIVLHFGAADYKTVAYVNGKKAGEHKGGYVSFCFDVTEYVTEGENAIVVYCEDDTRCPMIPRGKQSEEFYSHGCDYTRTTGIWQTVWLEFTPADYIKSVRYYPDIETKSLTVQADLCGKAPLTAVAAYQGETMGEVKLAAAQGNVTFTIPLRELHLWEVGNGRLYSLKFTFGKDLVFSYFGMRNVALSGYKFLLNGKPVFQRTVLDQGFYPDGIYTAPTDEALHKDVLLSKAYGFNGARLHQKVFEERFLYHCDKEGYMVWGEYGNWGLDHTRPESVYGILPEWLEEVNRDFNHPALIGWCPFNETWDQHGCKQYDPLLSLVYRVTKAADPTRPCIDTSGNYHVETDIFDLHDYNQNPEELKEIFDKFVAEDILTNHANGRQTYSSGQPVFMSEYGGIRWSREGNNKEGAWGYGNAPQDAEEYKARYKALTDVFLDCPKVMGFCYTQLTDVEQEQNGCYYYDRSEKFDPAFFYAVNTRKAAIEDDD